MSWACLLGSWSSQGPSQKQASILAGGLTEATGPLMSQDSGLKSSWLWLLLAYLGQMEASVHACQPAGDKAVRDQMLRPSFGPTLPCW